MGLPVSSTRGRFSNTDCHAAVSTPSATPSSTMSVTSGVPPKW